MNRSIRRLALCLSAALLVAACGGAPPSASQVRRAGHLALRDDQSAGNVYSVVTLPEQGPGVLLDAISGAKKSIDLEIYMITTSGSAGDIVQALIERSKAGVNVRVILEVAPFVPPTPPHCDSAPSLDINKKAREALMAGGVKVSYSSPAFKYTHEKAMLIDGQTAYVMTTNFTGAAFLNNREYILVDRLPADVASLGGIFDADWNARPYQPNNPALVLSPTNSRPQLRDLIDSAQHSIVIEVEFATDPELIAHLGAKAKSGVDVAVLVSAQGVDKCTGGDVDSDEFKALNAAGVTKVAVMRKYVLHAKCMVVDGERAYIGSENFSANSLDHNREVGMLVSDKNVVGKLASTIRGDWNATNSNNAEMPRPDAPADPL
jgi:cardiolipin synthase